MTKYTNDQRRRVAEELRGITHHRECDKEHVEDILGLYMRGCVDGYDPVCVSDLADLIEPVTAPTVTAAPADVPQHYRGDGEVNADRAMRSMTWCSSLSPMAQWWRCCAFKYLWRFEWKGGAEDLRKAKDCIERLLEEVEGR